MPGKYMKMWKDAMPPVSAGLMPGKYMKMWKDAMPPVSNGVNGMQTVI